MDETVSTCYTTWISVALGLCLILSEVLAQIPQDKIPANSLIQLVILFIKTAAKYAGRNTDARNGVTGATTP